MIYCIQFIDKTLNIERAFHSLPVVSIKDQIEIVHY